MHTEIRLFNLNTPQLTSSYPSLKDSKLHWDGNAGICYTMQKAGLCNVNWTESEMALIGAYLVCGFPVCYKTSFTANLKSVLAKDLTKLCNHVIQSNERLFTTLLPAMLMFYEQPVIVTVGNISKVMLQEI